MAACCPQTLQLYYSYIPTTTYLEEENGNQFLSGKKEIYQHFMQSAPKKLSTGRPVCCWKGIVTAQNCGNPSLSQPPGRMERCFVSKQYPSER